MNTFEDVVVCGAGAAGMAAALGAARAGARVCLIEARSKIGGTVVTSLIHTLGGFYDSTGQIINTGLAEELVQLLLDADSSVHRRKMGRTWVLNVCPNIYESIVKCWVENETRISRVDRAHVANITISSDRVTRLIVAVPTGTFELNVGALIDATGTAEVIRLIDPSLVDNETRRAAGGLIFRMRGVAAGCCSFPKGLQVVRQIRQASDDGRLPAGCAQAWLDTGTYEDEVYVKLFVPLHGDGRGEQERAEMSRQALHTQQAVIAFLNQIPEFARAKVTHTGELGIRDGGRAHGEYLLTAADVRQGRRFSDSACRCCWPIEYWDPDKGVSLEYLPDGTYYDIPLRALKIGGLQNVWVAGKCLSADAYAQASARVAGTCWATGEAAGKAAAATAKLLRCVV